MIVALGGVIAFLAWHLLPERTPTARDSARAGRNRETSQAASENASSKEPVPVANNRGADVRDGFRGAVHPLLHGSTRLDVTAHWTQVGEGRDKFQRVVSQSIYAWFKDLQPARPKQTYTESDFSAFLPQTLGEVGQLWALDADKVAGVLKQFHPRPRMHLVAAGRRAGPNGAFAILRAKSPTYLDIAFRIHAEFYLTPDAEGPEQQVDAWYTPAYLCGRLLVNTQSGTVDYFRLGLPTDKSLNVHLTMAATRMGFHKQAHDIVRVERMELAGGDAALAQNVPWTKALTPAEADRRLAKVFYKSLEINWTPFDRVVAQSRSLKRPIFAVVSWGALDDQSC